MLFTPEPARAELRAAGSRPLLVPLVRGLLAVARGLVPHAVGVLGLVGVDQLLLVRRSARAGGAAVRALSRLFVLLVDRFAELVPLLLVHADELPRPFAGKRDGPVHASILGGDPQRAVVAA